MYTSAGFFSTAMRFPVQRPVQRELGENASTRRGSMYLFKRNGIYYLEYSKDGGKPRRISTHKKFKQEALEFLRTFDQQMKLRKKEESAPISLKAFVEQYLEYSETVHTEKTTRAFRVTFRMLEKWFADVPLSEIATRELDRYFADRIRESSAYAARKDYINLNSAFNKALRDGQLTENPCKGIGRIRIPEKLPLFLSREEFQVLLTAIDNEEIRELVIFAANTGCRQGEIINLRWDEVDLKGCRMTLGNREHVTKSKRVRSIPLNKLALEVLEKRRDKSANEFVFTLDGVPVDPTKLSKRFKKYVKKAKLNEDLHFHSLRHSFASWLVMQGVSLFQVQRLLGHSTPTTTQIYAHLTNDNLAATVERLLEPSN